MLRVKKEGGIVFVPNNATRRVKEVADHALDKKGGRGSLRELAEIILDVRGVDESTLPPC